MKINVIILLVLSMLACESNRGGYSPEASHAKMGLMELADEEMDGEETLVAHQNTSISVETERKLIREGSMSFQCEDVEKTKTEVEKICTQLGAYSASEGQDSYGKISITTKPSACLLKNLMLWCKVWKNWRLKLRVKTSVPVM